MYNKLKTNFINIIPFKYKWPQPSMFFRSTVKQNTTSNIKYIKYINYTKYIDLVLFPAHCIPIGAKPYIELNIILL